jgi:cyclophilin family peptidyl-prolyl cis-trans isomerase
LSASNFLRYVDDGFYDGTVFHRVINSFMIQGGGFTPDMRQKSTRAAIRNEANNGLKNLRGTVAAARTSDVNSATAQFFINVVDNPRLDFTSADPRGYGYAVFGEIVAGMDTVDKIKAVPTCPSTDSRCALVPLPPGYRDVPAEPVVIRRARRK